MKLQQNPFLPILPRDADRYEIELNARLIKLFGDLNTQVNSLAERRMAAHYQAQTSAPTSILAVGDIVPKINPSETGTAGSMYVLAGWQAIADGTASTASLVEWRIPTGN